MKHIQTDAPLPETASSLKQSVIARTTTTPARSTDLHNIGKNSTLTDDSIALHQITHGILTGATPVQFMDAINLANSRMGNAAFLSFINGAYQQRREMDDTYERQADPVADTVDRGESAEGLLDNITGGANTVTAKPVAADAPVQMTRKKRDIGIQTSGPENDDYEWSEEYLSDDGQKGAAAVITTGDKSTQTPDTALPGLSKNVQAGSKEITQRPASALSASVSDSDKGRISDVKPLLVLLEIGQSPQPEMEAEFRHFLGRNCDILTLGALDHLDKNEIARHPPISGDDTLYTTLPPDNSPVLISKQLVIDGFRRRMDELKDIEAPVKILCCTGGFPEIETSNILMASDIITGAVRDKVPAGSRLGVFIPDKDQVPEAIEQWGQEGYEVSVVPLSPEASDDAIEAAAHCMRDLSPDAILYDCMGYSHKLQTKVETICSTAGIIAIGAAAHLAERLLGIQDM